MTVFGIGVVQNEADVIADSLNWASRFCEHIWLKDLGSVDDTWEILNRMKSSKITVLPANGARYTSSLRGRLFCEISSHIPDGSWIYVFDADEFIDPDPRQTLSSAEKDKADLVKGWHVNFYPTRDDFQKMCLLGEERWTTIPLADRLRRYKVDCLVDRFIRKGCSVVWHPEGLSNKVRYSNGHRLISSREQVFIRHYRYRSPRQIKLRFMTRTTSLPHKYGWFAYDRSDAFEDYVKEPQKLEPWDGGRSYYVRWTHRLAAWTNTNWRRLISHFALCRNSIEESKMV